MGISRDFKGLKVAFLKLSVFRCSSCPYFWYMAGTGFVASQTWQGLLVMLVNSYLCQTELWNWMLWAVSGWIAC